MESKTKPQMRATMVVKVHKTNKILISFTAPRINKTLANPYLKVHLLEYFMFVSLKKIYQGKKANSEINSFFHTGPIFLRVSLILLSFD